MAKKQTRRSISVSRTTYERLKAFCEANNISMSQLVETRVNDFLGEGTTSIGAPVAPEGTATPPRPRPVAPPPSSYGTPRDPGGNRSALDGSTPSIPRAPLAVAPAPAPRPIEPVRPAAPQPVPMTSAAARYAVEPPPPIIKPKPQDANAPKPAEKRPDQIFTF